MQKGDRVNFPFGRRDKKGKATKKIQGEVVRIHEKNVYIRADFPHHQGKIIKRKVHEVEAV